jgi:hypothetical protein
MITTFTVGPRKTSDSCFRRHLLLGRAGDFADSAHQQALALTAARIVITDEVLAEYLTFFSTGPEQLRREAVESVENLLASSVIRVIPQNRESFLAASALLLKQCPAIE